MNDIKNFNFQVYFLSIYAQILLKRSGVLNGTDNIISLIS